MRFLLITSLGLIAAGCAAQPPTPPPSTLATRESGASTALVFDPPLTLSEAPINLARNIRTPAAFAGFDEPTVSFTDVVTDNHQSTDGDDYVRRDSVSERISTLHR